MRRCTDGECTVSSLNVFPGSLGVLSMRRCFLIRASSASMTEAAFGSSRDKTQVLPVSLSRGFFEYRIESPGSTENLKTKGSTSNSNHSRLPQDDDGRC